MRNAPKIAGNLSRRVEKRRFGGSSTGSRRYPQNEKPPPFRNGGRYPAPAPAEADLLLRMADESETGGGELNSLG